MANHFIIENGIQILNSTLIDEILNEVGSQSGSGLSSNSNSALATQQSIKYYVDNIEYTKNNTFQLDKDNNGPLFKNNNDTIELKNYDDTEYTNLSVGGLIVNGVFTYFESEIITIADNIIVLNSNFSGLPFENAGIEINRGISPSAALIWNETEEWWQIGLSGFEKNIVDVSSDQILYNKSIIDLNVGINNNTIGMINIYGDNTSSPSGALINLYSANDYSDIFKIKVNQNNLYIESKNNPNSLIYNNSLNSWIFNDNVLLSLPTSGGEANFTSNSQLSFYLNESEVENKLVFKSKDSGGNITKHTLSGSGESVEKNITQIDHGFSIGDVLYFDGLDYQLALSADIEKLGLFVVSGVINENNFKLVQIGWINGLTGLIPGEFYFVSFDNPGQLTTTEPVSGYSNPILLADSIESGYVLPWRASVYGNDFNYNLITGDVTYYVGSGGDYITLSEALDTLSRKHPIYNSNDNSNSNVTLMLKSGFILEENISINNQDLGWIQISSEDSIVSVDHTKIIDDNIFYFNNSTGPKIDVLFDVNVGDTNHTGIKLDNSYMYISTSGGIRNADTNIYMSNNSNLYCAGYNDFSNSNSYGIYINNSSLYGNYININNSQSHSIYCTLSKLNILYCNFNNSNFGIFAYNNSYLDASNSTFNNCITSSGNLIYANNSQINITNSEIKNSSINETILYSINNAYINANSVEMTGSSAGVCLYAKYLSKIDFINGIANGVGNTYGVLSRYSSCIDLTSANVQKGGSPTNTDIKVLEGSFITAISATGGLSQSANTITSNGIIFQ